MWTVHTPFSGLYKHFVIIPSVDLQLRLVYTCEGTRRVWKSTTTKYKHVTSEDDHVSLQMELDVLQEWLAKISAVSRKLIQPKRTIKQNVLRGKMSISTSG